LSILLNVLSSKSSKGSAVDTGKTAVATPSMDVDPLRANKELSDSVEREAMQVGEVQES
jgi:hypothetical protein